MEVTTNQNGRIRTPWGPDGFQVLSHVFWRSDAQRIARMAGASPAAVCGHHHPALEAASERGDAAAADRMVSDLYNPSVVAELKQMLNGQTPIIATPHVPKEQAGRNLLDITFADRMAEELNGELSDIFQERRMGRKGLGGLARVLVQPRFHGEVVPGAPYILADDQVTMGSTMAALRGYIELRGGRVIAATAISNGKGSTSRASDATDLGNVKSRLNFNLASDPHAIREIKGHAGEWFENFVQRRVGFTTECLTRFEADCVVTQYRNNKSRFQSEVLTAAARLQPASA